MNQQILIEELTAKKHIEVSQEVFNSIFPEPQKRVYYLLRHQDNILSQEDQLQEFLIKYNVAYQGPWPDNRNHKFCIVKQ